MNIAREKISYEVFTWEYSNESTFEYDGNHGKFSMVQWVEGYPYEYSLDEGDYWCDKKLVKAIKEFKAKVEELLAA